MRHPWCSGFAGECKPVPKLSGEIVPDQEKKAFTPTSVAVCEWGFLHKQPSVLNRSIGS